MEDFRVEISWRTSRKRRLVERLLGPVGVNAVVDLWAYAAVERTDGDLSGLSDEAIACEAGWTGDPAAFIDALTRDQFRLLDGGPGERRLHNWAKRQPWIAGHKERSEAAQTAARARWERRIPGLKKNADECAAHAGRTEQQCPSPSLSSPILSDPKQEQAPAALAVAVASPPESPESLWLRKIQEAGSAGRLGLLSPEAGRLLAIRSKLQWSDVLAVLADPKCAGKNWRYVVGYLERVANEPKSPGPAPFTAAQEAKMEQDKRDAARMRDVMRPLTETEKGERIAKLKELVGGVFSGSTVRTQPGTDGEK